MNPPKSTPHFLAILIYEEDDGWRCEEPRMYSATHPEIAYHLALRDGKEQRYGRTFLGLSHLEETIEEVELIGKSQKGDASELVSQKEALNAFNDPKWLGQPFDEDELSQALTEPDYLMEFVGLDDIPWHKLTHAYGTASDVPTDIRRMTSSNAEYRQDAIWQLFGSIYHQGTLYPATEAAVPFILQILTNTSLPDRGPISGLLKSLAESAAIDPVEIEKAWKWRVDHFGDIYECPASEMAVKEIAAYQGVLKCLNDNLNLIQTLTNDDDADVAKQAQAAIDHLASAKVR